MAEVIRIFTAEQAFIICFPCLWRVIIILFSKNFLTACASGAVSLVAKETQNHLRRKRRRVLPNKNRTKFIYT